MKILRNREPWMNLNGPYWWYVNIGSGNGSVSSGNKPSPEPMLIKDPCHHMVSLGPKQFQHSEAKLNGHIFADDIYKFNFSNDNDSHWFKFHCDLFLGVQWTSHHWFRYWLGRLSYYLNQLWPDAYITGVNEWSAWVLLIPPNFFHCSWRYTASYARSSTVIWTWTAPQSHRGTNNFEDTAPTGASTSRRDLHVGEDTWTVWQTSHTWQWSVTGNQLAVTNRGVGKQRRTIERYGQLEHILVHGYRYISGRT